jgi:hypothetical protein
MERRFISRRQPKESPDTRPQLKWHIRLRALGVQNRDERVEVIDESLRLGP